jgi:hypothetical protein
MNPTRRTELLTQEVGEELLVYDRTGETIHRLDQVASLVWRHADGHTSREALAMLLGRELETKEAEPVVELALARLSEAGLLADRGMSGMQKGLLVGAGLALLVPVVESLRAPTPAAAFSF